MKIKIIEICPVCGGDGISPFHSEKERIKCTACNGTGRLTKVIDILAFEILENKPKQVSVEFDYKTNHSDLPLYF